MRLTICTTYTVTNYTDLELPEGKTADDIKDVSFESGEGVIDFKDGTSLNGVVEAEGGGEVEEQDPVRITWT